MAFKVIESKLRKDWREGVNRSIMAAFVEVDREYIHNRLEQVRESISRESEWLDNTRELQAR